MKKNLFIMLFSVLFMVPAIYAVSAQRGFKQSIKTGSDIFGQFEGTQISNAIIHPLNNLYVAVGVIGGLPHVIVFDRENQAHNLTQLPWSPALGVPLSAILELNPDESVKIKITNALGNQVPYTITIAA